MTTEDIDEGPDTSKTSSVDEKTSPMDNCTGIPNHTPPPKKTNRRTSPIQPPSSVTFASKATPLTAHITRTGPAPTKPSSQKIHAVALDFENVILTLPHRAARSKVVSISLTDPVGSTSNNNSVFIHSTPAYPIQTTQMNTSNCYRYKAGGHPTAPHFISPRLQPTPPIRPIPQSPNNMQSSRSLSAIRHDNKANIDMGDSLQEKLARPAAGKRPTCRDVNRPEEWKDHVIRLYFQNVNGLRLQDAAVNITETFLHLKNIEADIFGLVETQLHCCNPQVQRVLQDCKRRVRDQCKMFLCSTEEDWATQHKPGGTRVGVTGSLVGRVRKQYHDKYGRWTRIDLLGRDGHTLTIICAYQVVQDSGVCGDKTTYSQQIRLMRLDGIREPSPRKIFIQDLKVLVKFLHSAHHDVILMGDFNKLIGAKPSEMASVINAGHLTDTYCFRHGLDHESTTYARGTKRVDYVLVSHRFTEHIRATGAEPFNYRIFSDHCGLFVDFALPGFFDRACNELVKHPSRDLIVDCPRHVKQSGFQNPWLSHTIAHLTKYGLT
jgi:hypothetical protein